MGFNIKLLVKLKAKSQIRCASSIDPRKMGPQDNCVDSIKKFCYTFATKEKIVSEDCDDL